MYIAWYDRRPSRSASARRMISSSSFGATFTFSRFSTPVANSCGVLQRGCEHRKHVECHLRRSAVNVIT